MNRTHYLDKMQGMVNDGIRKGVYEVATDTTIDDLKKFKNFLYRNFKKFEKYKDIIPLSNQPAQLYGLGKTHKFKSVAEINVDDLKFRPIIAQRISSYCELP